MPRYLHLLEDWGNRGECKITPQPIWRRLWPLKVLLPYYVGDKVSFRIHFENPNPNKTGISSHVLYEVFGDDIKASFPINDCENEITGTVIDKEGDIRYCVGYLSDFENSNLVFTTKVESWDSILSKWWWTVIGAFFSFVLVVIAWLLGFIHINPFW
jgi:hypothetical protein